MDYLNSNNLDQKIVGNQSGTGGGYKLGMYTNRKVEFEIRTAGNAPSLNRSVAGGTELNTGTWYYVAGVYSNSGNYLNTYVNGILDRGMTSNETLGNTTGNIKFGREPLPATYFFNGRIDEVRVQRITRDGNWLLTEYNNQSSPSTFYNVSTESNISSALCKNATYTWMQREMLLSR